MKKKVQKDINKSENDFHYHLIWLIKGEGHRERASVQKKNSATFTISLKSRKRKGITANSQVKRD